MQSGGTPFPPPARERPALACAMQEVTVERLGEQLFQAVSTSGTLSDEHLSSLHFLYDSHFVKALQIVDQGGVWCFVGASSGRRVYQVHGQSAESYVVFPNHYCSCQVRGRRQGGGACRSGDGRWSAAVRFDSTTACRRLSPLSASRFPTPSLTQAFFFDVVSKSEAVACKHQLAARLAKALGKAREQTVSDLALAHLLQE